MKITSTYAQFSFLKGVPCQYQQPIHASPRASTRAKNPPLDLVKDIWYWQWYWYGLVAVRAIEAAKWLKTQCLGLLVLVVLVRLLSIIIKEGIWIHIRDRVKDLPSTSNTSFFLAKPLGRSQVLITGELACTISGMCEPARLQPFSRTPSVPSRAIPYKQSLELWRLK